MTLACKPNLISINRVFSITWRKSSFAVRPCTYMQ